VAARHYGWAVVQRWAYGGSLALGGIAVALAGESETAGIALVCLALLVLVAARPFARFSPRAANPRA
jgi:hypothetical protein